jgi:hypothetical protein
MTSLQHMIYAPRSISLVATGVFTGMALTMNLVSVPAIKASKDPLPSFVVTYSNASKIAITSIVIGTVSNALSYYRTEKREFLYAAILTFVSIPITVFAIAPVNNQLFAMQKLGDDYDRKKVHALVNKWSKLHSLRFLATASAFLINILYKV